MKLDKAVKVACEAIDAEIQKLAVDSNLFEMAKAELGRKAYYRRLELKEARAALINAARKPTQSSLWTNENTKG